MEKGKEDTRGRRGRQLCIKIAVEASVGNYIGMLH